MSFILLPISPDMLKATKIKAAQMHTSHYIIGVFKHIVWGSTIVKC